MAAGVPGPTAEEWLRRLEMYRGSCLRPGPDRDIPADVAAYNEALRLLAGEAVPQPSIADRITARVFPWLFPEAEAEIQP
jgi:hypothetical protein